MLSVAMCTYNGAKYVEEQLLSILKQKQPVDEIVVCDDGSKDDTINVVRNIATNHPEVTWNIQQNSPNLGVTKNFEKALSLCTGDIIFLSDQDDIWLPEKTKRLVNYLETYPEILLVFSDSYLIDSDGKSKSQYSLFDAVGLSQLREVWDAGMHFEIENVEQRLLGSTFAMRKEFVRDSIPFSLKEKRNHDGQLAMTAVINGCAGMLCEKLTKYRVHDNNTVGLKNNWVFNPQGTPSDNIGFMVEPRPVYPFFKNTPNKEFNKRVAFYEKRTSNYASVAGKILLCCSIFQYVKYYKQFWFRFFRNDLLYGIIAR
jgi:glycosyltransferase involved in cell wall biosynthesis